MVDHYLYAQSREQTDVARGSVRCWAKGWWGLNLFNSFLSFPHYLSCETMMSVLTPAEVSVSVALRFALVLLPV